MEMGEQVHRHHAFECSQRNAVERSFPAYPRVVDQNVHAAKVPLSVGEKGAGRSRIGDVALRRAHPPARCRDLRRNRSRSLRVAVVAKDDVRAFACKSLHDHGADAAAAACDKRRPIRKPGHPNVSVCGIQASMRRAMAVAAA